MYPYPYQFIEEDPYILFENPIYITHKRPTITNHAFEDDVPTNSYLSKKCVTVWFFILVLILLVVFLSLHFTDKL